MPIKKSSKKVLSFLLLISAITTPSLIAKEKMNVLFISVDDMNTDLACYGVKQVKTPNIDRLAKMGALFNRAYCQQPLCGPSRASMMTGLRPNTTGFVRLNDDLRKLKPDALTMGQYFLNNDYYVARVGKIYHYGNPSQIGTNGNDDAQTWGERYNPAGIDKTQEENIIRFPGSKSGFKDKLGISMAVWDPVSEDSEHTDGMVADKTIELIEAHKDEPFFIAAGFFNPHCPYVAPKKYFDLYPLDEIKLHDLELAKKDLEDVPAMAVQRDTGKKWPYYFNTSVEEARRCKQAYYACISFVDALVGKLIATLEKNNLMDNTMIIFWSDHGYFLGDKGLWYKRKNFERSLRTPLIIAAPGMQDRGKVRNQIVEAVDIFPTVADYSGLGRPKSDGLSLRPLLESHQAKWSKPAISQVYHKPNAQGYSIRVPGWRFTEWNNGEAGLELYNHNNDPWERTNLAKQPEYAEVVKDLKAKLSPFTKYPTHK